VKDPKLVRVLHVIPCDDYAGTELLVASYVERFNPAVVDVEVATLAAPGPIAKRLAEAGVPVHSLGGSGLARAGGRLAALLRQRRYDVVNAHGFKATMIARVLVRVLAQRAAFITSVHALHVTEMEEVETTKGRLVLGLERLGSRLVDLYELNTLGGLRYFQEHGFDPSRLRHIPNALDVDEWPYCGIPDRDGRVPVVTCVARMVPRKRQADLIRALGRLRDNGVAFRAVFVGEGPTLSACKELTRELDLAGQLEFRGRVIPNEVRTLLQESDVFCLPSLWEGTAISIMEAMATGLPVVATAVNGIDEVVADGETGILVPPYRDDGFAEALEMLLSDDALAREMGRKGRARVEAEFQLDRIVRTKEELYRGLASRI
jgi:glycosyltransferase involved in cell wall biosynthesis